MELKKLLTCSTLFLAAVAIGTGIAVKTTKEAFSSEDAYDRSNESTSYVIVGEAWKEDSSSQPRNIVFDPPKP